MDGREMNECDGMDDDIEHDSLGVVHAQWTDIPGKQSKLEREQQRKKYEAVCWRVQKEVEKEKMTLNLSGGVSKARTGPPLQLRIVDPSRQFPGYGMFLEYGVELPRTHVEKGKGFVELVKDMFHLHDMNNFGYVQDGVWKTDASTHKILQHLENLQYAFVILESSKQNFIGEVTRNAVAMNGNGLDMVFQELRECNVHSCNAFNMSVISAHKKAKTFLTSAWISDAMGSLSGVASDNHKKLGKTLETMQLALDAGSALNVENFYRLDEDDLTWALGVKQTTYDSLPNLYDKMRRGQTSMDKMVADHDLEELEIFQMSSRGKEGAKNQFVMNYVINPETDEAMWAPPDYTSNYQNGALMIFLAMAIEREGDKCGEIETWGGDVTKDGLKNGQMVRSPWLPSTSKDRLKKHELGNQKPHGFVILPAKYALIQDMIMNSPIDKANGDRLSKLLSNNPSKSNSRRIFHPSKAFYYGVQDPEKKHTSVTAMPMLASQVSQMSGVKVTIAGNNVLYSSLERPNTKWKIGSTALEKKPEVTSKTEATKQSASKKNHKRSDRPAPKLIGQQPAIEITPVKRKADMEEDTSTVLTKSAKMNIDFVATETENAVVKAVVEQIQKQNLSQVLR